MIKIVKGNDELIVSNETYKTMFKDLGYVIANEEAVKSASSEAKEKAEVKNIDTLEVKEDNFINKTKKDVKTNSEKKESIDDILNIISKENKNKNK